MRLICVMLPVFFSLAYSACAGEPIEIDVWPGRPPGVSADEALEVNSTDDDSIGLRITKVSKPEMTVFRCSENDNSGTAVIVCPGGGYNILAWDLEGIEVAKWLNRIGITAIVLKYRVPRSTTEPHFSPPLRDVQRTIRLTREYAQRWQISPDRVGVLGFSAGGNLAALASTNYNETTYEPIDAADKLGCRPDFSCLIYPAYLTKKQGEGVTDLTLKENLPVNKNTPPAFLISTGDDGISAANSMGYYMALKNNGVPAELHVYPSGGHGYGLRPSDHAVSSWPDRAERWFRSIGVLPARETFGE